MEQGSFVRHRTRPDWGLGRILLATHHYTIEFEARGLVKLAAAVADSHLEVVDDAHVPPAHPLRDGKPPCGATPAVGNLCEHCERPLTRSAYNQSRTLKSCPHCSETDGHVHIFYEHPDSFGLPEDRSSSEISDGGQSDCTACRQRLPSTGGKRCQDVIRE